LTAESDLPPAATPGTVLGGKYRIERVLGRGGMGVVLLATHLELQKRVAVKLLLAKASPVVSSRFRREAQVAAQLESPHIAQVLDFGVSDDLPFLVMEYLEGHDLETELHQRGVIPVPEAITLVLEGCVGIAQAHAAGLVHRDLKPANLFLAVSRSGRRTVKVLDFGLIKDASSEAQSLTASAEVFGTPQYMAPEQIQSSKNVDARCDQHALALVLFELCAGSPAYEAESLPHLIVVIATHPPPSLMAALPHAPPGLADLLTKALAKRPADRFADLGAFAAALVPYGGPRAAELAAEVQASLGGPAPPAHAAVRASPSGTAMMPSPPSAAVMTHLPPTEAVSSPQVHPTYASSPATFASAGAGASGSLPAGARPATRAAHTEPSFNASVPAMSRPLGAAIADPPPPLKSNAALFVGIGASLLGLLVLGTVVLALASRSKITASSGSPVVAISAPEPSAALVAPSPAVAPADAIDAPSSAAPATSSPPAPVSSPSTASAASSAPAVKRPPAGPTRPPAKPPGPKPPGPKCTGLSCY
jgi:serine/threonine protein kinase